MTRDLDVRTRKKILTAQGNEITEHFIYKKLSESTKDPRNRKVLKRISDDELEHYNFWKGFTGADVEPNKLAIWRYVLISRLFGITFGIKLMERGEEAAQDVYDAISKKVPEAKSIVKDEDEHEKQLIDMIDEERLRYVGSMVLGLNDALVELTGALAGFTFALQNTLLIAIVGLITGIAASLSMGASEYLSTKMEGGGKSPAKASVYTSVAYVLTVIFLILPFFIIENPYLALGLTIVNAIVVISVFTFYISVAKDLSFRRRFSEMTLISLGVAALTFAIGVLIRTSLNVEI